MYNIFLVPQRQWSKGLEYLNEWVDRWVDEWREGKNEWGREGWYINKQNSSPSSSKLILYVKNLFPFYFRYHIPFPFHSPENRDPWPSSALQTIDQPQCLPPCSSVTVAHVKPSFHSTHRSPQVSSLALLNVGLSPVYACLMWLSDAYIWLQSSYYSPLLRTEWGSQHGWAHESACPQTWWS